jgi:glutaredoxin
VSNQTRKATATAADGGACMFVRLELWVLFIAFSPVYSAQLKAITAFSCFVPSINVLKEQLQVLTSPSTPVRTYLKRVEREEKTLKRLKGGMEMSTSQTPINFYTNPKCPFAQRVWIALEEKKLEYSAVVINLYGSGGKPGWFMQLNPKGEVPVIKHNENVVIDSSNIIRQVSAPLIDVIILALINMPRCLHVSQVHRRQFW